MDIDRNETVGHLKKVIKNKKPSTMKCDADVLKLYFAKKNNAWLAYASEEVEELKDGDASHVHDLLVTQLPEVRTLNLAFTNLDNYAEVIHVLVVLPTNIIRTPAYNKIVRRHPNRLKRWVALKRYLTGTGKRKRMNKGMAHQQHIHMCHGRKLGTFFDIINFNI